MRMLEQSATDFTESIVARLSESSPSPLVDACDAHRFSSKFFESVKIRVDPWLKKPESRLGDACDE
jgi:hypothetical protein